MSIEQVSTIVGCSAILHEPKKVTPILVGQRSNNKPAPLQWELIGGTLEYNEQPLECIFREALEEIACKVRDVKLQYITVDYRDNKRFVVFNYVATIEQQPRPKSDELANIRWIGLDDVETLDWRFGAKAEIMRYFKDIGLLQKDTKVSP